MGSTFSSVQLQVVATTEDRGFSAAGIRRHGAFWGSPAAAATEGPNAVRRFLRPHPTMQ